MSAKDIEELLGGVEDTRELVLRPVKEEDVDWLVDELHLAWIAAADEAWDAYHYWRERPGRDAYLVYRAAEDRADAALAALASEASHHSSAAQSAKTLRAPATASASASASAATL